VITPDVRGTGVGNALVEEFLVRCAAAGVRTAELTTTSGPTSAAGFYSHTGWTEAGRGVTFDGQQVLRFRRGTHPEVQG
jgi:N-acetylglutamate synthase-like GNAT family acetyltransferase